MPGVEQTLIAQGEQIRALMYGGSIVAGRQSATVLPAVSWATATGYADAGGPYLVVLVGPSGRLVVTSTARLTANAGRTLMGWTLTGPYLDDALTTRIKGVPPVTIPPDDSRALSAASAEVTASHRYEQTGLVSGWYSLAARYSTTGTAGSAQYRQLLAEPI